MTGFRKKGARDVDQAWALLGGSLEEGDRREGTWLAALGFHLANLLNTNTGSGPSSEFRHYLCL